MAKISEEEKAMEKRDLYGYRKQIVKAYWNKGLTENELAEIMQLSLRKVRRMRIEDTVKEVCE